MNAHSISPLDVQSKQAEKKEIRKIIKAKIKNIASDRERIANQIFQQLCSIDCFVNAETIALYVDFQNELPTRPFIHKLFDVNILKTKTVCVPYCSNNEMTFVELSKPIFNENAQEYVFTDLESGAYGILEPLKSLRENPSKIINPNKIDVILVPGLAFAPNGERLGRGAGYYDRYLPLLRRDALTIGLAYDEQIIEELPTNDFDARVSMLVTPSRIFKER